MLLPVAGTFLKGQLNAPSGTDFYFYKTTRDAYGNVHEKYQQTFNGIKVEGKEYILHWDREGKLKTINGDYDSIAEASVNQGLSFSEALTRFKSSHHLGQQRLVPLKAEQKNGKLMKRESTDYEQVLFKGKTGKYILAYKFNMLTDNPSLSGIVYVSAATREERGNICVVGDLNH